MVAAGGIAAAVLLVPAAHKLDQEQASSSSSKQPKQRRPAREPQQVRLSAAEQRRLVASISLFVRTAVARHHPEQSWPIVDPSLREGLTQREWKTGNIPVVPYPAVGFSLIRLQSFDGFNALVEIILIPQQKAHLVRKTFQIQLRHRARSLHPWAVSSWVPEGVSQAQINLDTPSSPKLVAEASHPTHLSAMWIYVPLGALLGGVILVPAFVLTRDARRFRRAGRAR